VCPHPPAEAGGKSRSAEADHPRNSHLYSSPFCGHSWPARHTSHLSQRSCRPFAGSQRRKRLRRWQHDPLRLISMEPQQQAALIHEVTGDPQHVREVSLLIFRAEEQCIHLQECVVCHPRAAECILLGRDLFTHRPLQGSNEHVPVVHPPDAERIDVGIRGCAQMVRCSAEPPLEIRHALRVLHNCFNRIRRTIAEYGPHRPACLIDTYAAYPIEKQVDRRNFSQCSSTRGQ
jgi:hypothetical protein